MYLPLVINKAQVLITVKTYPHPSSKYYELVCTAGLLDGKFWIRIYPIPFTFFKEENKYPKYSWIELNLERYQSDFRPESYNPQRGLDENIIVAEKIGTNDNWATRKSFVLQEVFTSMQDLIGLAKSESKKSLATLKPVEIVDFIFKKSERQWKEKWLAQAKQGNIFETDKSGKIKERPLIQKLPYEYYYKFLAEGDINPRKMKIEDWEIGALFWNCLRKTNGDEIAANTLVFQKYFTEFVEKKDIYFFLGTTKLFHNRSPNPFFIIGVFYPPKTLQSSLF